MRINTLGRTGFVVGLAEAGIAFAAVLSAFAAMAPIAVVAPEINSLLFIECCLLLRPEGSHSEDGRISFPEEIYASKHAYLFFLFKGSECTVL
jgi:hypothetical protein